MYLEVIPNEANLCMEVCRMLPSQTGPCSSRGGSNKHATHNTQGIYAEQEPWLPMCTSSDSPRIERSCDHWNLCTSSPYRHAHTARRRLLFARMIFAKTLLPSPRMLQLLCWHSQVFCCSFSATYHSLLYLYMRGVSSPDASNSTSS